MISIEKKTDHKRWIRVAIECGLVIVVCISIRMLTILNLPCYIRADVRDYVAMAVNYNAGGTMRYQYDKMSPIKDKILVNHRPPSVPVGIVEGV